MPEGLCLKHLSGSTWWTEADAREFFAAHAGSNLELPAFAKLHDISVGRVYRWRKKLGITTPRPNKTRSQPNEGERRALECAPQLLKVQVREAEPRTTTEPSSVSSARAVTVVVDQRFCVVVEPGFDPAHLRAVLEVVGRC